MPMTPEQDQLLQLWQVRTAALATAKAEEMKTRLAVQASFFPDLKGGTNKFELPNDWELKLVAPVEYDLDGDRFKMWALIDKIKQLANDVDVDALFKWKINLGVKAYKSLDAANAAHVEIKKLINNILTTSFGAPQLEIVPPKEKK